jgi:hypothetical protein
MAEVDAEIRPEPEGAEREALLAALRDEAEPGASPHGSAWRASAGEPEDDYDATGRPRNNRGATRA